MLNLLNIQSLLPALFPVSGTFFTRGHPWYHGGSHARILQNQHWLGKQKTKTG